MRKVLFGQCGMRPDGQIEPGFCGLQRELRPYGKNGLSICVVCGLKPRNVVTTMQRMREELPKIVFNRWVKHPREVRM